MKDTPTGRTIQVEIKLDGTSVYAVLRAFVMLSKLSSGRKLFVRGETGRCFARALLVSSLA